MSKGNQCPVCNRWTYREHEGFYDQEEWGQGAKLTPDQGYCSNCGFFYEEHIRYSFDSQVANYKERIESEMRSDPYPNVDMTPDPTGKTTGDVNDR